MRISGRGQGIHEGPEQGGKGWLLKNKSVNIQMFSHKGHSDMYTRIFTRYWLMNYSIFTQ